MLHFLQRKTKTNDPDRFFKTDHLHKDLKGRSVRGGAITMATQGLRFVMQMGSTAVLARLLVPEDYGLVGMTTVVTGFIRLFGDIGLSQATIQTPKINHKQVSTLFWINCALGLFLMLLVMALSPAVAWFYGEPRVTAIMCALSVNFLIGSTGTQHSALLTRQMRFAELAKINIFSMTVGVIAGITAGFLGASYWTLVIIPLANVTSSALANWFLSGWWPGLPDRKSGVGDMLKFGGNVTGFQTVNYFSRNLDNILIGRVWGSEALGLYAKAYQLLLLPVTQINRPITSVALPVLSRLQDNPEQFKRYYFKAISLITTVGMPIACFMFAAADQIIIIVLGEQWTDAVPIFRLLIPAAIVGTFNVAGGWAYRSLGMADRQFKVGIIGSFINTLIFLIGVRWGAIGVAAAFGLSRPFMAIFTIGYCYKGTFLKWQDFISSIYKPCLASILSGLFCFTIFNYVLRDLNPTLSCLLNLAAFTLSYFSIWLVMPNGYKELKEIGSIFRDLKKRK